jgi:hypothetical protein
MMSWHQSASIFIHLLTSEWIETIWHIYNSPFEYDIMAMSHLNGSILFYHRCFGTIAMFPSLSIERKTKETERPDEPHDQDQD